MLLEFLTDSEYFEFKNDSLSLELIAGDFDIETDRLVQILQYCFQLDLFQLDAVTNIIACKSLDNRLEPLLSKRKRDRIEVTDSDNTHSRVKESKVKEKRIEEEIREEVQAFLKRKDSNTMDVRFMVRQWIDEGHTDIMSQLKAMKAVYQKQNLVFPTRIETLTKSFEDQDWIARLAELDPEKIAENIAKEKRNGRQPEPDTIGTSPAGSLG
jgi:hypothetical protein